MWDIIFYIGIALTFTGLGLLGFLIYKTRNAGELSDAARNKLFQKLILINFIGVFIAILGLIIVVISLILK